MAGEKTPHCSTAPTSPNGQGVLFTDADVVMNPTTLRRAISFAMGNKVDHLAVMPEARMPSLFLESFVGVFLSLASVCSFDRGNPRPPKSSAYVGVGAFNLIRSTTYRAIEGHKPLRMRPDDDVMLGKLVKLHQHSQGVSSGIGLIWVPWYSSIREVWSGWKKTPLRL
ncbi:MAG: hypothetical protein CM1200mP20_15000 [Pseudomonadota bacterium]|nr:MAG: hypothetical protein CM1200mP20_15000 [Pseudomonadota bacterium]